MNEIVEVFGMIRRDRSLWKFLWVPLALAVGLFGILAVVGVLAIVGLLGDRPTVGLVAGVAWVGLLLFFSGAIFLALAALCSSWLWDGLSKEVERRALGYVVDVGLSGPRVVADAVIRLIATLGLATLAYGCGLVTAGIGAVLFAGWAVALDVTSNAYLRRGVTFGSQGRRVRRLPGWPMFVVACGVLAVIPVVNVLVLPILVAAGTLKVARAA